MSQGTSRRSPMGSSVRGGRLSQLWATLRRYLWPIPRQTPHWTACWPLVLFLALFGLTCWLLERRGLVLFANPKWFALLLCTPWIWWLSLGGYAGLSGWRATASLLARLLMVGLFAALLAEPRAVKSSQELVVIYVVDVSDSVGDFVQQQALQLVARDVAGKPQTDLLGLVIFGGNAAVEFPPRQTLPMDGENITVNSLVARDATNVEQALSLGAAMLPEDKLGRLVLISDGVQTEGNLASVLDDLKARGIQVDVLPAQYDLKDEVWLERLELPQLVKQGETYEAGVLLSSMTPGRGVLRLQENGREISRQEIEFPSGKSRYVFPLELRNAGYYEYTATIDVSPERDRIQQNNRVVNSLFLEGERNILVVYDEAGDVRDRQDLVAALQADGKRIVEEIPASELDRVAMGLMDHDCIIFCNVPTDSFDPQQLQAVRDAVFNLGIGFLMIGGNNSFGPGGYHHTVIEDALPVTMDITQKKILPKGALAIILHTCEFPEGNTWAKRVTREAVRVMGARDEVAILCYEGFERWVCHLTPAGQSEKISRLVEASQPGDMPTFSIPMEMALQELANSDAATKHLIIISDGDPQPPSDALLQKYVENQISVSTVSIFPHGGNEIGLLRRVAAVTGGRYYFPKDSRELPRIFIKEAKTLKRSMIQRKHVFPELDTPHPVLKGIEGLPPIDGYVITTPRPTPAVSILTVPGDEPTAGEGEAENDPLLAIWQYGLGKTAAFTSDLSNNWASEWTSWTHYEAFVTQLVTEVARLQRATNLRMWTYLNGNEGVIGIEDFAAAESFQEMVAQVAGPDDKTVTVPLKQVGPRRYQASVPLWGQGRYHVVASPVAGERKDERSFGGLVVSYSPEYLRFRSNPQPLRQIAESTGGRLLEPDYETKTLFPEERDPRRSSRPIDEWLLTALACLVPIDVGLRRVQIDWSLIKSWLGLGGKVAESTRTMSTLRERKLQVDQQLASRRQDRPLNAPAATAAQAAPAAPSPTATPPTSDGPPTSTTERLLELKRKRQKD